MKAKNFWNIIFGAVIVASYQPLAIAEMFKRDYEYKTPIPKTGQVTIRKPIKALPAKSLFVPCPTKSDLSDFAESTNFLVMVCRDRKNDLQKYWIQKSKKTGKLLRLTAQDLPDSPPVSWETGDYSVYLYIDGIGAGNAYLESYNRKSQQGRAEALLYHYSKVYDPR